MKQYKEVFTKWMTKVDEAWDEYEQNRDKIQKRINVLNRKIEWNEKQLRKLNPSIGTTEALGYAVKELYPTKVVEVLGPFGLRSEWGVAVKTSEDKCSTDSEAYFHVSGHGMSLKMDTGEKTSSFEKNTIGDVNGFNNKTVTLEDWDNKIIDKLIIRK